MSGHYSVPSLGQFEMSMQQNFVQKVAQTCGNFLGSSEKRHILSLKTTMAKYWATFGKMCYF